MEMKATLAALIVLLAATACQTAPEQATGLLGYRGIDKIHIQATGME